MWLQAPNISCVHGFSDRHGGISPAPYSSLNLGGSDDTGENITANREIALAAMGLSLSDLCNLKQVHGNKVNVAAKGRQEGDALVTKEKGLVLAVSIADCYPVLFYDEVRGVAGAAHAGWRGTVSGIVTNTITEMQKLGANVSNIKVAVGQGICQEHFEVGNEVIEQFEKNGFPSYCWKNNRIDLILCNLHLLKKCGVPESKVWAMKRCTFEKDFFSHRRDKGRTGRMWAVISMT